ETVRRVTDVMHENALNWVGQTQLRELIAAVARCNVFLTNDSGPLHIAVATRVPTVAIFGPTTRELGFFPYGSGHRVIERALPCRPCSLHGGAKCPLEHFQCMKLIAPQEVFEAVQALLMRIPSPPEGWEKAGMRGANTQDSSPLTLHPLPQGERGKAL